VSLLDKFRRKVKGSSAKYGHQQGRYCETAQKNRGRGVAEKNQNKLKGAKKTDRKTEQANPTGHRIPDPHRLPSPPSLLPEPDQIHAAVSSYGSSPFPTAARGLLLRQLTAICHHGVGRGRKKRPAPVSEDAGKKGLGGGSGGGGVPQLGWWRRRRLLRCSWRGRCFNFEAFVLHFFSLF